MKWNKVNKISVGFAMHTLAVLLFAVSIVTASPTSPVFAGNDTEEASPTSPIIAGNDTEEGSPNARIVAANDTEEGSPTARIIGGKDAPEGKYPYQVSILHNSSPTCSGSIINGRFILTAAHCIYNRNWRSIKVVAGTNFYDTSHGGVTYTADSLIWHRGYDTYYNLNDIGLIKVAEEIRFTNRIQPIALAETYYVPAGETVVLTGWGRTNNTSPIPAIKLQEIYLMVISQPMCESLVWQVSKKHICTETTLSTGACFGDSGSPLVLNGVQIGIVSYGHPCALGYPDVHTRVYSYGDWIKLITTNHGHLNRWNLSLLAISTLVSYSYSLS